MHQNPTAHNSWTPQTTACQHRGHQQANQNVSTKTSALLQQKSKRPTPVTRTGWAIIPCHDRRCILQAKRVDQKKGVNQIPVASKDVKATQEMAFRNPNPCSSRPWFHRRTTTNLVPLKWHLHHHVARNRSWDALTNQPVRHPCQCRLKPHLGELSTSQHTWRTI